MGAERGQPRVWFSGVGTTPITTGNQKPQPSPDAQTLRDMVLEAYQDQSKLLTLYNYVGPNRFVDASVFDQGDLPLQHPATAQQVMDTLNYDKRLLYDVSERLRDLFGYELDTQPLPQKRIGLIAVRRRGTERETTNIVNLGSGFIQMIWIMLHLSRAESAESAPPASRSPGTMTVGIEEPEVHLHPALQDSVSKVLAGAVRRGVQVLVTTQKRTPVNRAAAACVGGNDAAERAGGLLPGWRQGRAVGGRQQWAPFAGPERIL